MNLDGGGSSTMSVDGRLINRPNGTTTQRSVPSILSIVPSDSLKFHRHRWAKSLLIRKKMVLLLQAATGFKRPILVIPTVELRRLHGWYHRETALSLPATFRTFRMPAMKYTGGGRPHQTGPTTPLIP